MLKPIRNRLILIFTCSTGLILTTVLVLVLFITQKQMEDSQRTALWNNYLTISQKLHTDNEVSNLWLSELEIKNHLIIHIEENGTPLLFSGAWRPSTDRSILIERVKEQGRKDHVDTNLRPITRYEVKSEIYSITGMKKDRYLGEILVLPTDTGYRSAVILRHKAQSSLRQVFIIILLDLTGIILLFLVSRFLVGGSLKPAEESKKRQTEFIAAASHELKSPLTVIRANSSAILLEPDKAEHYIHIVDKECKRLSDLIEDLLLLANTDARRWKVRRERIDMDHLLIEAYDTFLPFCHENGKQLELDLQEKMLPGVEGDAFRISQVLTALIDNAVSYSKEGDTIILRAFAKKNNLWIEIEDHGIGIEEAKKKEVFERFYREDRARKDKNHYGLGLSIAKELVELHGGSISCRDTQGGGATFFFTLPICK